MDTGHFKSRILFPILYLLKIIQNRHQWQRSLISSVRHLYYSPVNRIRVKAGLIALYNLSGTHLVGNGLINVFRGAFLQAGEFWGGHG